MMKKLLFTFFTLFLITGCKRTNNKPTIITTIHPLYSITKAIACDDFNVVNLIPPGYSPHTYEPTPSDINNLNKANLIIFIGFELETWLYPLIKEKKCNKIEITKFLKPINKNPHLWLDPVKVIKVTKKIKENLLEIKNCQQIKDRTNLLIDSLKSLDKKIKKQINSLKTRSYIVYHPAFYYFAKRYGLKEFTITKSPNKRLTPVDMKRISNIIKKENIKVIFTEEQNPSEVPYTIASDYGLKVYKLDPIGKNGEAYIELIEKNLKIIVKALNE